MNICGRKGSQTPKTSLDLHAEASHKQYKTFRELSIALPRPFHSTVTETFFGIGHSTHISAAPSKSTLQRPLTDSSTNGPTPTFNPNPKHLFRGQGDKRSF